MPTFKKSEHILTGVGEFFDPNWMDSDTIVLPPKIEWDYQREMQFEDVYVWEQLCEHWEYGVYAAWDPYAEYFVLRKELEYEKVAWDVNHVRKFEFETFYGKGAQEALVKRMTELNIVRYIKLNKIWVEPEKMWLYS
jgi:hypothetical protein